MTQNELPVHHEIHLPSTCLAGGHTNQPVPVSVTPLSLPFQSTGACVLLMLGLSFSCGGAVGQLVNVKRLWSSLEAQDVSLLVSETWQGDHQVLGGVSAQKASL